ncbi:MAG: hypothetical protein M1820_004854 [Bogoriella megaspora]|nr:MAG: hypothetical protein M1820_004854 [Bogoriella megaspora]
MFSGPPKIFTSKSTYIVFAGGGALLYLTVSLVPFQPKKKGNFIATPPQFDLLTGQSFQWATSRDDSFGLAQLDISSTSETEKYLLDETFSQAIESVKCSESEISIVFKDGQDFHSAKSHWDWVNRPENTFFLFLDQPGCGKDDVRQPYNVTKATFADKNSIKLAAVEADDISKTLGPVSLDFNHDLFRPIIPQQDLDGVTLELDCSPCSTTGTLQLQVVASAKHFGLSDQSVQLSISTPQQLGTSITLGLKAQGALTEAFDKTFALPDINLAEIPGIPGIFEAGPILHVQAQASISEIQTEVTVSAGVDVSIDPNSQIQFDVFNPDSNSVQGWTPSFHPQTPSVSGNVSVTASVITQLVLDLEATVFTKGLAVGVVLAAPEIDARLSAAANSAGGVCDNPDAIAGVSFDLGASAELDFFAGSVPGSFDIQNLPHKKPILSTSTDIFSTCLTIQTGAPSSPGSGNSQSPSNCPAPYSASITVNCQQNIPQQTGTPSQNDIALNLAGVLQQNLDSMCNAQFDGSGDATHETFNSGFELITVQRESNGGCLTHCHDAINNIINTCILGSFDYGGIATVGGELYNISNSNTPSDPLVIPAANGQPPFTITPYPSATATAYP